MFLSECLLPSPMSSEGEPTSIQTIGMPSQFFFMILGSFAMVGGVLGLLLWADGVGFISQVMTFRIPGLYLFSATLWAVALIFPLESVLIERYAVPTAVNLTETGVLVVSRRTTRLVPWGDLRPPFVPLKGEWGCFAYGQSAWTGRHVFWVTKEQARAVLMHPRAPAQLFPPEFWSWLGIPAPLQSPPDVAQSR